MWPWRSRKPFSRSETLQAADRARGRGQVRKAVAGYRAVLAAHPDDLAALARLAPLLARQGERGEALACFRAASQGQLEAGFVDRALSLLLQAAGRYPDEETLWTELARLQVARGRRADAAAVLVKGGRRLLGTRYRAVGERLLRLALQVEPWHPEAVLLLARTLARLGRRGEALSLLDALGPRVRGRTRHAVNRLAFRLWPSPPRLWRWIRER
jgi:tetratricopeptide (TPR) repeat protein